MLSHSSSGMAQRNKAIAGHSMRWWLWISKWISDDGAIPYWSLDHLMFFLSLIIDSIIRFLQFYICSGAWLMCCGPRSIFRTNPPLLFSFFSQATMNNEPSGHSKLGSLFFEFFWREITAEVSLTGFLKCQYLTNHSKSNQEKEMAMPVMRSKCCWRLKTRNVCKKPSTAIWEQTLFSKEVTLFGETAPKLAKKSKFSGKDHFCRSCVTSVNCSLDPCAINSGGANDQRGWHFISDRWGSKRSSTCEISAWRSYN